MKKILSVILTLVLVFANSYEVKAQKVKDINDLKSKNYRFEKDWTGSGVFGNYTFFFNVSEEWQIKDSYINLIFTESQLLNKEKSTLTITLNDCPVYSIKLGNKKELKNNIKISLPKEKIIKGFNEVKIKTYRRISEKPCTDDVNSGNWILLHKESYVHIDFQDKKDSKSLKEFPFPYMKESDEMPLNSIIVVPDNPRRGAITGAMMLCANFGAKRKFENISTKVYKFSEVDEKDSCDIIFIGSGDNSPKEILGLLSGTELKNIERSAIIKETVSPYNADKKMLIIMSNDENKLTKAANLLSSKDLMKQINSSSIVIDDNMNVNDPVINQGEKISLSDLGYNNVLLEGGFRQEASFILNIPKDRFIKKGARIVLNTRYSKNLDFNRSLLTVYINDTPIGSKKLDEKNADNDTIQLDIPEDTRNLDYYEIKVAFDLQLKDGFCTFREGNNPWGYILKDSYVYLPYKAGRDFIFENYPNPFVSNGQFKDLTIVLPDNLSSEVLTWVGNISANLGHDLQLNGGILNVLKSSEFLSSKEKGNFIVIGTPQNNKIIKETNKNMYIKFNKDFTAFESNEKVNLLDDYSKEIATIQLVQSPYSSSGKAMIIAAVKEENLSFAQRYLKDLTLIKNLKGDSVIIDRDGNLRNFNYSEKKQSVNSLKNNFVKNVNLNSETKFLILFFIIILSFISTATVLFIRKYKKQ